MIEKVAKIVGTLAKSPFAQALAIGGAVLGSGMAILKAVRGLTPATALYTRDASLGGKGISSMALGGKSFTGKQMMRGGAIGLAGMAAGSLVSSNASSAAGKAFGSGLSGAAAGASMGMIAGPYGALIGGAIGGLIGSMTGYLDQQEATRQAKRDQIQKEIDERGNVAQELRMLRKVMEEKDTTIEMDSGQVGKMLNKGAAMHKSLYTL
mgnify:CR=1 FL=1